MNLKKLLFHMADVFEETEEFLAIRRSMILAIPILMIGSVALVLISLPLNIYQEFIQNLGDGRVLCVLKVINSAAFSLYSIILVISVSFHYAILKNAANETVTAYPIVALASYIAISGINSEGFSISEFGVSGIFISVLSAVLSSKALFYLYKVFDYKNKEHAYGVDYVFSGAVRTIAPAFIIISTFAVSYQAMVIIFGYNSFQQLFSSLATGMFEHIGNGLGAALIFSFSVQLLWFFGIHGNNVFEAVARDNFIRPVEINAENVENGLKATEIFSKTFYDVFVIMGGCGVALSLLLAILLVGKRSNTRGIAKMGLIPALFNISEIVVFGIPVIFTPIFLIPFILVPLTLLLVSYAATAIGLVPCVSHQVEWTTPIILGGYKATGSYAGSILQVVNLCIGACIYMPFVKLYEEKLSISLKSRVKELERELWEKEETAQKTDFLTRNDMIGSTAKMLTSDLKYAIEQKELYLEYQAQADFKGKCIGAEALLRWKHPTLGNITPPLIIALAKEAGYLKDIELFLFDEVCSKIQYLEKVKNKGMEISVNITGETLFWDELEFVLEASVEKYGIKQEHLCLEITEQDNWLSSQSALQKVQRLKEKGHKLHIDDFGMGHTSLLYLQTDLFDVVKLDGVLTKEIDKSHTNQQIISSIVYLSKSLNFDIIAEYVETEKQKECLEKLGCTGFQGYLYSKPVPFEQFIELLERS